MNGLGLESVIVIGLAVSQVVEVVRHSKLTLPLRRWALNAAPRGGFRGFVAGALGCAFCFSHWVSGAFTVLLILALWQCWYIQALAVLFAAVRVANLTNDILYGRIRTPKYEIVEEEDLDVDEGDPDEALGSTNV